VPFEVVKITPWADKNGTSFEALPSSSQENGWRFSKKSDFRKDSN